MVTFKNAAEIRAVVEEMPLDRLLLETDGPYMVRRRACVLTCLDIGLTPPPLSEWLGLDNV